MNLIIFKIIKEKKGETCQGGDVCLRHKCALARGLLFMQLAKRRSRVVRQKEVERESIYRVYNNV